jgi:hypothetical protein
MGTIQGGNSPEDKSKLKFARGAANEIQNHKLVYLPLAFQDGC